MEVRRRRIPHARVPLETQRRDPPRMARAPVTRPLIGSAVGLDRVDEEG